MRPQQDRYVETAASLAAAQLELEETRRVVASSALLSVFRHIRSALLSRGLAVWRDEVLRNQTRNEVILLAREVTALRAANSTRDETISQLRSQFGEARLAAEKVASSLDYDRLSLERKLELRIDEVRDLRASARGASAALSRHRGATIRRLLHRMSLELARYVLNSWVGAVRSNSARAELAEDHAELTQQEMPNRVAPSLAHAHHLLRQLPPSLSVIRWRQNARVRPPRACCISCRQPSWNRRPLLLLSFMYSSGV